MRLKSDELTEEEKREWILKGIEGPAGGEGAGPRGKASW